MTGIYLLGVSNVTISNNLIDHYSNGILMREASAFNIENNTLQYMRNNNIIIENCDRKKTHRKFTIEQCEIGSNLITFSCTGIRNGCITIGEEYYPFERKKKEKITLEISHPLAVDEIVSFYGTDTWGNQYYKNYRVKRKLILIRLCQFWPCEFKIGFLIYFLSYRMSLEVKGILYANPKLVFIT